MSTDARGLRPRRSTQLSRNGSPWGGNWSPPTAVHLPQSRTSSTSDGRSEDMCAEAAGSLSGTSDTEPPVRIELLNRSWSRCRTGHQLRNDNCCHSLRLPGFVPRCAQNVPSQAPDFTVQRAARPSCPEQIGDYRIGKQLPPMRSQERKRADRGAGHRPTPHPAALTRRT
jgi:hypothetical protein